MRRQWVCIVLCHSSTVCVDSGCTENWRGWRAQTRGAGARSRYLSLCVGIMFKELAVKCYWICFVQTVWYNLYLSLLFVDLKLNGWLSLKSDMINMAILTLVILPHQSCMLFLMKQITPFIKTTAVMLI